MPRPRFALLLLALAAPVFVAGAQNSRTADAAVVATSSDTARPAGMRSFTPTDLKGWRNIRSASLSNDGKWFAYLLAPNDGSAEVVLQPTGEGAEKRFPIGQPSGASVQLSGDAKWLAFTVTPTEREARAARRARRPVQNKVALVNLATGEKREFEKVRRFVFNGEKPTSLALHGYPAESQPGRPAEGADMRVVDLVSGTTLSIGNVGDFAFDESGRWLAWTVDARDQLGNGIQLRDMKSGVVRALDGGKALYRRMTWHDSLPALAALRGVVDSVRRDTAYALVAFRSVAAGTPTLYEAEKDTAFPDGMRISPDRGPTWSDDLDALYFGIREKKAPTSASARGADSSSTDSSAAPRAPGAAGRANAEEDPLPRMTIWHWKDPRLQSQQQVEENRDKSFSFLSVYRLPEKKFIRLADEDVRDIAPAPRTRWTLGSDNREYEREGNLRGLRYRDVYVIDQQTGERRKAVSRGWGPQSLSPDGTKLLYWSDGHYHVYDIASGTTRNITEGLPVSFVNVEDDHNLDRPAVPPQGWTADGRTVLLSDRWDVWSVPVGGGKAVNLTVNGRQQGIRYQRRLVFDPRERGFDLRKPLLFAAYGERTKQEGVARVEPGKPGAKMLMTADARMMFQKARHADTYVFTRQTVRDYPDYWVTDGRFGEPRRLTDANPQQRDFAWSSGARLVDYVTDKGDSLQAALYLPANYEPGKQYPTVVYIYEKLSQNLHAYSVPNETRALNPAVYTNLGYAVLMPDIVYKINDPGMSAVWAVIPAVKAAIATGVVDSAKVGLHGHSWGGYQTAFLVTQTDMFKAAVAGAALTDMVSMYSSIYWNSGSANQPIFESSQGRFKGHFLENTEAYIRNSPAYHADKVKTPLILLHNDKDGAVDFNQGVTFYNTLRRLGKDVIMLQYIGENHGLAKEENQKDYAIRMREFFDHHLRGMPAPDWMKEGVPRLQLEEHLRGRQQKPEAPKKAAEIIP